MSHLAYGDEGLHDEDGRHRGRPVETADIILPAGRYEVVYRFPVE